MDILEQRVRRSSRLRDGSAFKQFLAYACKVRDEDEVYFFMEENEVGLDEPEFWAAKLHMLRNKCEYTQFIKVMKQCKRDFKLKKHPKYWVIEQVEREVQNHLEKILKNKVKSKRSARQYETLNLGKIQKETRKFGKVEVYVDHECRRQYRLQDLVDYVTTRLKDDCEYERNCYLRDINEKPLSFISKNKDKLSQLAADMFGDRKQRPSFMDLNKRGSVRGSFVGRISNSINPEIINTPDLKKKSESKRKKNDQQFSRQNEHYEHSIQNFNKKAKRKLASSRKSRKSFMRIRSDSLQFDQSSIASSMEKVRHQKINGSQLFSNESLVSSGKKQSSVSKFDTSDKKLDFAQKNRENRKRSFSERSQRNGEESNLSKDLAFIEESLPQAQTHSVNELNQLENIIKEIQMTKYESQTISQIDSNKENAENIFVYGQDSQSIPEYKQERKLFETIRKDNSNAPESEEGADSSSNMIYKQLLGYLQDDEKEKAHECCSYKESYSQKNKKKRISRISEEKSYSYSETKHNNRSGS